MKIRVAAVQLNSILGNVEENMTKAMKMLEQAFPTSKPKPDLIILPELALTGYNFKSPQHISPFLEYMGKGKSFDFAKEISNKWDCFTLLGYPEKFRNLKLNEDKIYNSAILVDSNGNVIHNYRKTHLYETDKTWGCSESPEGFQSFDLNIKGKNIKSTVGICMDLNPYEFKAPFESYEFANFAAKEKCQLVLIPTAWMNSNWDEKWSDEQVKAFKKIFDSNNEIEMNLDHDIMKDSRILYNLPDMKDPNNFTINEVDGSTGRYWVIRLNPLYSKEHRDYTQCVVVCNRSGMEDKLMYAGTSSMYSFFGGEMNTSDEGVSIDFKVEGSLKQGTEGVLCRELEI